MCSRSRQTLARPELPSASLSAPMHVLSGPRCPAPGFHCPHVCRTAPDGRRSAAGTRYWVRALPLAPRPQRLGADQERSRRSSAETRHRPRTALYSWLASGRWCYHRTQCDHKRGFAPQDAAAARVRSTFRKYQELQVSSVWGVLRWAWTAKPLQCTPVRHAPSTPSKMPDNRCLSAPPVPPNCLFGRP